MMFGEHELEYLQLIQANCPGEEKRLVNLSRQPNFSTCVLPFIAEQLRGSNPIPDNIELTFWMLLGRPEGAPFMDLLLMAQKGEIGTVSLDFSTQHVVYALDASNSSLVLNRFESLRPSIYLTWALAKLAVIHKPFDERIIRHFKNECITHPTLVKLIPQWRKKCLDKLVMKGLRRLETLTASS